MGWYLLRDAGSRRGIQTGLVHDTHERLSEAQTGLLGSRVTAQYKLEEHESGSYFLLTV
jgi:hypothetical protein